MFVISPVFLPGAMIINAVLMNLLMLVRNRASLSFRPVRYAIGGNIVGTVLAGFTLALLSEQGFALAFGALILLAVTLRVIGYRPQPSARHRRGAGGAPGWRGAVGADGGPPVGPIVEHGTRRRMRANL